MKIFITYASAGAGHLKSAEAIYDCLRRYYPQQEVKLIDVLAYSKRLVKESHIRGYTIMVSYMPWLWKVAFYLTSFACLRPLVSRIRFVIDRLNTIDFTDFLIQENPDVIISTHFLPSESASYLKSRSRIKSKLITVVTDFGVHPFWVLSNTDIYVGACQVTRERLISMGVKEDIVKALGIPIDEKFAGVSGLRGNICAKIGLNKNKFTVLVATGSFGIGPIEEIVDELYPYAQIIVVCARNKRLFKRLNKKKYPGVRIFGFVDNMHELMSASDIIITKPGGLTIAEILAAGTAPVFIRAIPGQETENIKILSDYGIGVWAKCILEIKNAVLDYRDHPDKILAVKENMDKLKKPYAARELCNNVCTGSFWPGN